MYIDIESTVEIYANTVSNPSNCCPCFIFLQDNPGPSSVDNSSDSCIEANLQICAENCISTDDKNASSYQGW